MKLQLLQPRTGVRSRPLSSALALCSAPPANNAISSAALELRVHTLEKIIPFLYHNRGYKNNYVCKLCWDPKDINRGTVTIQGEGTLRRSVMKRPLLGLALTCKLCFAFRIHVHATEALIEVRKC